jgi:hypothetical protein
MTPLPRPRRALLFVPGDQRARLEKAAGLARAGVPSADGTPLPLDAVIADLEDGVALSQKSAARQTIVTALRELDCGAAERIIRINPVGTPYWLDDLAGTIDARPDAVLIAKVEAADQVSAVADWLTESERERGWPVGGIGLLALLETVQSGIVITKTVVDSGAAPDAELQISYTGTIKAGIDLATIDEDDITVTPDGAVRLVLPPPRITYCDLGKPEVHAWTCRGWAGLQDCSSRYERMQGEAYNRAMGDLLEAAETMDLLGLARQNAEATLYDLLQKLGFASVTFEVSGETPPPDPSCQPD